MAGSKVDKTVNIRAIANKINSELKLASNDSTRSVQNEPENNNNNNNKKRKRWRYNERKRKEKKNEDEEKEEGEWCIERERQWGRG